MSTVLSISVIAILAAVCGVLLQKGNREIALLFSAAAAIFVFLYVLPEVQELIEVVQAIAGSNILSEALSVLLKALGIVLVAQAAVHVCKDAGENALASGVEFSAKLAVLLVAMPLLQQLMNTIQEVLAV